MDCERLQLGQRVAVVARCLSARVLGVESAVGIPYTLEEESERWVGSGIQLKVSKV